MKTICLFKTIFLSSLLALGAVSSSSAQSEITFKVNLTPQLEDSIYVPGRDRIYVKGNVFPLKGNKKVYLKDPAPADSIYEATVDFPSSANGEKLKYNYFIFTPQKKMKEDTPRFIRLKKGERELDALYFNSFAW
ncbi:hypothetical protein LX73_0974 [Fodinibius salinus]|uniref:Uncharacterized protein n=1 Tax=Fodinibius salinus TaxID=860790 RepID=A0A5D3YRD1_9BACT|nr:hypothetical protein [Fodinibius salinus]TYP95659.1 hypothetical protein LX73_0974 [Fodinibius salinus]